MTQAVVPDAAAGRRAYNPAMRRTSSATAAPLLLGLLLAGCEPTPPVEPQSLDGRWRGELLTPGGALPFGLEFAGEAGGALEGWLINGAERARIGELRREGDQLTLSMPAHGSVIRAVIGSALISGQLELTRAGGELQLLPFTARPGDWRFFADPVPVEADFSGRWAVSFMGSGEPSPAIGEFTQRPDGRVTGTFLTPTGDYRYLEGQVRGRELFLSTFGGGHVFLFRARMDDEGTLDGDFWSGLRWHESWTARRDDDATLPDPTTLTALREDAGRFTFEFSDLEGRPVSLDDEYFAGKAVIVTLGGSWCPNCHDEAAYLAQWYRENAGRGVAIVGLMYEHFGDFARASQAVRNFRDSYGIGYELLVAGISDKQAAADTLPMLDEIIAYPTTIYLDREHRVRRVHTGFLGPGTGDYYVRWREDFLAFMDALLAEEPG
jgi:thiol-disulfide isomerase/thioredoxin